MIYYHLEDDYIKEYNITVNKTKLKKLRQEVIENCSEIRHNIIETTRKPDENEHIYNLTYEIIGKKYNDYANREKPLYLVEYDWYIYPNLVTIIDKLLYDNLDVLEDLYKVTIEIDKEEEQLKELYTILENAQKEYDYKLAGKTTGKIIAFKKNQEQNIIKHYYKEVENCLTYKLEKKLSINTLMKVESFFEDTKAPISTANKILSKKKTKLNNLEKSYE